MNVLAIDTSTDVASVALWRGGRVAWEREGISRKAHTSAFFPLLAEAAAQVEGGVDRIAVGLGPGSYAGVRIGISAALGLQLVWGCELVGLPSVLALEETQERYRVIGDARRGTWYFSLVEGGACIDGPRLLEDADALRKVLAESTGEVYATEVLDAAWESQLRTPRAATLARWAALDRGIVARKDLEPLYLREVTITQPKERPLGIGPS